MEKLHKTCLYECHVELGARMVEFGGWLMPVQYDGIVKEHTRTRTGVSMFDTCHMGQISVKGPGSCDYLSHLFTTKLRTLKPGRCRYGFMLNEQGGVIDDLITYRLDEDQWFVVVNAGTRAGDFKWMQEHLTGDTVLEDISSRRGKIDVQGPSSPEKVSSLLGTDLSGLKYFSFGTLEYCGEKIIVSRTGYTGETGFEIYGSAEMIVRLWRDLLQKGVMPAGLGARDTLRLEAGLPLHGHELTPETSPVEAGMIRFAGKDESFIGREVVHKQIKQGPSRILKGFKLQTRQSARNGNTIYIGDNPVGTVTSGSFSPTLDYSIGMGYIDTAALNSSAPLSIDNSKRRLDAELAEPPFYRARSAS